MCLTSQSKEEADGNQTDQDWQVPEPHGKAAQIEHFNIFDYRLVLQRRELIFVHEGPSTVSTAGINICLS